MGAHSGAGQAGLPRGGGVAEFLSTDQRQEHRIKAGISSRGRWSGPAGAGRGGDHRPPSLRGGQSLARDRDSGEAGGGVQGGFIPE